MTIINIRRNTLCSFLFISEVQHKLQSKMKGNLFYYNKLNYGD